jgi:hypothetical protein
MPRWLHFFALAVLLSAAAAHGAEFGTPGGPPPSNLQEIFRALRGEPYDLELLISFGTSKGGSAGHLALAIRDPSSDDDLVYSANFYADRAQQHASGFYTADLMARIPKMEYLYGTRSSLGNDASFGLDYGEVYKRSVVGIRVFGVPAAEKDALASYFRRINDDYHHRARNTEYHDGEVKYDYLYLNCAKTIGSAFHYGAGYRDVDISSARILSGRRIVAALNANIPTEMALKLMRAWHARGYAMDVVLYRKYANSPYADPHDDEPVAFKDLPDRFPSVLSRDFRREQGRYEDVDNLFAMYLLYNLGRYSVRVDGKTQRLEFGVSKTPLPYAAAAKQAADAAHSDSRDYSSRAVFTPKGTRIGDNEAASAKP